MKICNYLIPFFNKEPDKLLIEDIRDCFIEIEDLGGRIDIKWGYCKDEYIYPSKPDIYSDFGFFPAYRFSDKLALTLVYNKLDLVNKDYSEIIEDGIYKLNIFKIHSSRVKYFMDVDSESIAIRIEF
jgi:hypothetical protein